MSFWRELAKWGGDAVGTFYGDPMLGHQVMGAVNAIVPEKQSPASRIGQVAGGIEGGRAQGLINESLLQQRQDQLAQTRATQALEAPHLEARNSVQGDILANSQDATISGLPDYIHMGQVSGGLRPSLLSDSSRALGANMSRTALANNLSGKDVPDLTPLPEANAFDKVLQGVAIGGGFLDALKGIGGRGGAPPTGGYQGEGTPGYPGDQTSAPNNPMPLITSTQGEDVDPELLKWVLHPAQAGAMR